MIIILINNVIKNALILKLTLQLFNYEINVF